MLIETNKTSKVVIILLNFNNWEDTIECLKSLIEIDYKSFEIILIDNDSTNNSVQNIETWLKLQIKKEILCNNQSDNTRKTNYLTVNELHLYENRSANNFFITIIRAKVNKGYAAGNNIGIRYALNVIPFTYLWILNNDTVVEKNSLTKVINHSLKLNDEFGIIGTTVKFYHKPKILQSLGCTYNPIFGLSTQLGLNREEIVIDEYIKEKKKIDYVSGCSVIITKKFIESVGLLSEDYFLYFEEIDWALRGKKFGFRIDFCYESVIYHKDGASTKIDKHSLLSSPFSDYHFSKSKIRFTKKFYKFFLPSVYFSFILVILNRIKRGQYQNIFSIIKAIKEEW